AWVGLRLMARRAVAADAALDLADREAGAEFVALTRSTERREHDRLLHDTVLNTLTALARGGDSTASEVRARGRHDVTPEVPVPVATALAHAVREALANVASHAGTGEAWVTLRLGAAAGLEPGGLEVTVRDEGGGFDPARTDPARLGVRRSIIERVADWGGTASVRSAPGRGTAVRMSWTAPAVTDPGLAAAGQGGSLETAW
ncbi:MAG: sensor histidine kinase, partial [Streptosporangiaceae bacterium]